MSERPEKSAAVEPATGYDEPPLSGKVVPPEPSGLTDRISHKFRTDERSTAFWVGVVLGALLAVATALLIVQNSEKANLDWLWFDFTAPLWLLLFASALSGAVLGHLVPLLWRRARDRRRAAAASRKR